jgi:hypothetical protein
MSGKEIAQTLKDRKIILHGAHIFQVGIPAIMALAAAYATDRISRGTFFSTLNLFVARGHCDTDKPRGIKAEHLVALGIPKADADRLPLCDGYLDFWIVAGLFNGVLDMEDFALLLDPANKGRFWERHFGPSPSQGVDGLPTSATKYNDWVEPSLFSHLGTFTSCPTKLAIKVTCADLESSWRGRSCYVSKHHYVLRLEAAARKGQRFSLLGPYNSEQKMEEAFHDIFSIVNASYEGPSTAAELDGFVFTEPAVVPSKFASRTSVPTGYTTRPPIQCTLV